MIIKGNRHGNGAKLSAYLLDGGKHGERVFAPELHGFGLHPDDISKSFSALDAIASGKGIENPLFHIQIRLPKGDYMTPEQWDITTARTLKTAGLEGQPYARVFHADENTGELHCHLGVSLIDEQTHHAKAVPFYKFRFKALARKLEIEFDITRVKNEREGPIRYGATKNEEQQAQRLGFKKEAVRNLIRQCSDASDCGHTFDDALAEAGLILAQGDRRDYVVIDPKGGLHVLSERILDLSAAQIREKLSDLDRENMPTVKQAREFMLDLPRDRMDRLTRELAEVQKQIEVEQEYARRDPVREEMEWLDAVAKAAIEKEKREGQFVEPQQRENETRAGHERAAHRQREKVWPVNPPQPERKAPELFGKAATEAGRDDRMENLTGPAAQVWQAWQHSDNAQAYAAALDDKGIAFAKVTQEEAYRSHREADFAKAAGNYAPRFKQGEIVIVTEPRPEYRRDGEITEPRSRVHKLDQSLAWKFVKGLDSTDKLQGIDATIKVSDNRAQQRAADRKAIRLERATDIIRGGHTRAANVKDNLLRAPAAVLKPVTMGLNVVGKALEIFGGVFEPPILTPEQKRDGEIAARERQADVRDQLDHSNAISQRAQERRQEEEREAARQREERERYGGGRER